jgi:hypothetical protein
VTTGGRVLVVTAYGSTIQEALGLAYAGVDQVDFEGKIYRRDIAHRYEMLSVSIAIYLVSFKEHSHLSTQASPKA